jgi:formate--tetrahydrofolate ligase
MAQTENNLSDLDLNLRAARQPIWSVAEELGLAADDLEISGSLKAKLTYRAVNRILNDDSAANYNRGKLILVSAITPTKSGEGKTTVSIGLAQALRALGLRSMTSLRQPSMGPVFGQKGGGTGGGLSQLVPMEDINLHFTGDLHAVAAANNLLCAIIDNHLHFGNVLEIEPSTISFRRAIDVNDRGLREIVQGLGGKANGFMRTSGFDITAASEVMAVLGLSLSLSELKERLGKICIGQNRKREPVFVWQLGAQKPMAVVLKDALRPNLVQTSDGTPAFVHGGPFANIAHGTSSMLASRLALKLADFVVTEAGFGSDLGLEKYMDIVAYPRGEGVDSHNLVPDAVVLVATVKALKLHGGISDKCLQEENLEALSKGLANLRRHVKLCCGFGVKTVVAINKFVSDTSRELKKVEEFCKELAVPCHILSVHTEGGAGALELARELVSLTRESCGAADFTPAYNHNASLEEKLQTLVHKVYGGSAVRYSAEAVQKLSWLKKYGFAQLPVCVAKTQYSFSDDPKKICAPVDFEMTVKELRLSNGAGFVVAVMGDMMTMPGLPRQPSALQMDLDDNGNITLFY